MINISMRLHEILTEEQLDEINWKKGLATAATAGAMALGGAHGANAQSFDYNNSPIHRDLSNISNKLDQKIAQQKQANRVGSLAAGAAITSGLADLGGALQSSRFKKVADEIMASGKPWKIFKNRAPLEVGGTITIIAGNGQAAMVTDTSHLGMAGNVIAQVFDEEVSPGVYTYSFGFSKKMLDTNKGIIIGKGIGGSPSTTQLKLVDSEGAETSQAQSTEPEKVQPLEPNEISNTLKLTGKSIRSQISISAPNDSYDSDTLVQVFFDKEGNATKARIKGTTGNYDLDMDILSKVQQLKDVSGIDRLQATDPDKFASLSFKVKMLIR